MPTPKTGLIDHGRQRHDRGQLQRVRHVGVGRARSVSAVRPSAKVYFTTSETGQSTSRNT